MFIINPTVRCFVHTLHHAERELVGTNTKKISLNNRTIRVLLEKNVFECLILRLKTKVF